MGASIDLNADLGESFGPWPMGDDPAMLAVVSSANIACGFHAGDPLVMERTVRAGLAAGVALGAHPGYPDLQGFGRRAMSFSAQEVEAMVIYQTGALMGMAAARGGRLGHVKPHGALSNLAAVEMEPALAVARAVKALDAGLVLLAPAGSVLAEAGRQLQLPVAEEVFADRNYADDGSLVPRGNPRALIHDPAEAAGRVLDMVRAGRLRSLGGREIPCRAQSVCVHGDGPGAVELARALRQALEGAGLSIRSFHR